MYRKILVPIDGSETAKRGLDEAIGLAQSVGAQLRLLHVVTDVVWLLESASTKTYAQMHDELHAYADQLLAAASKTAADEGVKAETVKRDAAGGRPAHTIVDEAKASGCDAIVMGTHGRKGVSRLLLGSDASLVVSISPLPVLLVGSEVAVA